MLHNSGGFGPGGNPSNANISEKNQKISAPPNLGHNMGSLSEIAHQQLRNTSERFDIPIHGSYNYELSSYNANLGTFSSYQNRRLPDVFDPNNARYHDMNWQSTLATHMHSVPFQNMPHFLPPFEAARVSTDHRNQSLPSSHIPEHRTMDNYHLYNKNKDNFSHYTQSFEPTQQPYKMDASKQKKLENTVKLLENIITQSSDHEDSQPITNYNEKPTYLEKSDNQDKITLTDLLGDHEMQNLHYKHVLEMERNREIEKIDSKYKQQQIEEEIEQLKNNENTNCSKEFTNYKKEITEIEKHFANKETHQERENLLDNEQNKPDKSTTDIKLPENNENKQTELVKDEDMTINNESSTNTKQNQSKENLDDDDDINDNNETVSAEAELQIKEDKEKKIKTDPTEDANDSTTQEQDFSAIFLRDSNKMSSKDVKKGIIVNFVTSVEEATAAIQNGTTLSSKKFYECQYCNYYFKHPKRFLIHVKWHTFGLANEKREEIARQQELEKQQCKSAKTQQCDICEKQFKTLNSLTNHKQRFHSSEQLECQECGVEVAGVLELRAHRRAEHPESWVCETCRRQCSNKYTLAKHKRTHLEKHISCAQCDKLFATATQLKDHMRMHERIARGAIYKCSYCDKSFYQTYNLQAHEKTHSNERPFGCEICNTRFSTNSSLKRHLRVSHNADKPHACPECSRCFAEQRTLVGHMSKAHPGSGVLGVKAAKKMMTQSGPRRGRRGRKSKQTEVTSDAQESDMNAECM